VGQYPQPIVSRSFTSLPRCSFTILPGLWTADYSFFFGRSPFYTAHTPWFFVPGAPGLHFFIRLLNPLLNPTMCHNMIPSRPVWPASVVVGGDPLAPTKIVFCPSSCQQVRKISVSVSPSRPSTNGAPTSADPVLPFCSFSDVSNVFHFKLLFPCPLLCHLPLVFF